MLIPKEQEAAEMLPVNTATRILTDRIHIVLLDSWEQLQGPWVSPSTGIMNSLQLSSQTSCEISEVPACLAWYRGWAIINGQ